MQAPSQAIAEPESHEPRQAPRSIPKVKTPGPVSPYRNWRSPKVITSAVSGALVLSAWLLHLAGVSHAAVQTCSIAGIVSGAFYFGRKALTDLIFHRVVGFYFLMSAAAVISALIGHADEGAILVFLTSISEVAQDFTEWKTRSAIHALMNLSPKTALIQLDDHTKEIPVEELRVGDVFVVKPGEAIATDGVVLEGCSDVNQAPITGESQPVEKAPGCAVFAASINGPAALKVRATKTFADNTVARIIKMVEEAQEKKGQSQRFIEWFGARYSPLVVLAALAIAIGPPLFAQADWTTWITRATVLMVAASPCAMMISIPVTLMAALGRGAHNGVLIKGGVFLEQLAGIKVVAFDKTGTLTKGEPEVIDVILNPASGNGSPSSPEALLAAAAAIEQHSEHPLGRAIVQHAKALKLEFQDIDEFQALVGSGASARLNGTLAYACKPAFFRNVLGIDLSSLEQNQEDCLLQGKTAVMVGDKERVWGLITLRDQIRPMAASVITQLRGLGVNRTVMLTGDNHRTAQLIGAAVGIDEVDAELKPEQKVERILELADRYGPVVMVGDGVNDAPALAAATVGVAMGAAGTDVALETADVALMADDLQKLVEAIRLAHRSHLVVRQNLALSVAVVLLLVLGALTGALSLTTAVIGHELSEFLVIASGLRMLHA